MIDEYTLACKFHEVYERLAPDYGCDNKVEWRHLPSKNKALMIAVCKEIIEWLR